MTSGVSAVIGGRYRLDREIGRGGMGAVWLARDELLQRPVAAKRIGRVDGLGETTAYRAQREARLAAHLSHPHVVAVLDLVREDDHVWLVMEYVDSVNLTQLVRRDGPLTPDAAAALLAQAAEALAAAHGAGIVHRDVKPSNMLVAPDGRLKLSDFGIARSRGDETLTRTGLVVGSPAYLAPEVARGQHATEASDVWGLGVTAYFALTGITAYDTETGHAMATLHRIVSEEPPRPADSGWLAPLFDGTLVVDRTRRWSMREVAAFLAAPPQAADAGRRQPRPTSASAPAARPGASRPVARVAAAYPSEETVAIDRAGRAPRDEPGDPSDERGARGRAAGWVVAAVLVLALVAGGGWLLLGRDRAGDAGGTVDPTAGPSPTAPASSTPTTPSSPSETSAPADAVTAAGMSAFVRGYLRAVTADPAAGWRMLTPAFQLASGPYAGYARAWRSRPVARLSNVSADPATLRVSYDVAYRNAQGGLLFRDSVTLALEYADGAYLIAGEG